MLNRQLKSGVLLLLASLFLVTCKKDDDEPATDVTRADYLGIWQCDEFDQNQQPGPTFQIEILAHPSSSDKILIDNFSLMGSGYQAEATIDKGNITIPQQIISASTVSGSGFISNKLTTIELQYVIDDGSGQPENLTATCNKL